MKTAEEIELATPGPSHQDWIQFPVGLLGFENFKEYIWLSLPGQAPFCWLQAVNDPTLAFLLVPIGNVLGNYAPEIPDQDVAALELACPSDALLYGIVTLRRDGRATVNLKGPIIINRLTGMAKQVVLANAGTYPLQYPLPAAE
jgi:flagellar assembly factor FliW